MPRYKLTLEYDGTPYAGWQKQQDKPSVQAAIADAAFKFCGTETEVIGAGRTDAGVHAAAQVAHIDLPRDHEPFQVMQGLNFYLFTVPYLCGGQEIPNRVAIIRAERAGDDFHARFSATRRHYLYRIINRRPRLGLEAGRAWHVVDELDAQAMNTAGGYLLGHHDFTSFRDTQCQAKSPLKTLERLEVCRAGGEIHVVASARSFLHHQMRIMVGTLAMVGKGKWKPEDVRAALEARDRAKAGPTAPPDGLYLTGVDY